MSAGQETHRAVMLVQGHVQGVGFRYWTRARARELGLDGHAANLPDGRVEVSAQGRREEIERLYAMLSEQPSTASRPGHVDGVSVQWHPPKDDVSGFAAR